MSSSVKFAFSSLVRIVQCYFYDMRRFYRFSSLRPEKGENTLTDIVTTYHIIEKGLALSDTRYGFGQEKIVRLIELLKTYQAQSGDLVHTQYLAALQVLQSYLDWHTQPDATAQKSCTELLGSIADFLGEAAGQSASSSQGIAGGFINLTKDHCRQYAAGDFRSMSQNRYSVRSFTGENVPADVIRDVVSLARKSPSTCNRQTSRVYSYSKKEDIARILDIHKGTRGFSEQVNKLLLVAGDLQACQGLGDRNQVYVDSGLFAMNLLYGLQFMGLGGCILHWNVYPKKDRKLRKTINIAPHHTVVCLIAVGHLPDTFKVPVSQRRSIDEILIEQ